MCRMCRIQYGHPVAPAQMRGTGNWAAAVKRGEREAGWRAHADWLDEKRIKKETKRETKSGRRN